jgi:chromosome segregation ATPase
MLAKSHFTFLGFALFVLSVTPGCIPQIKELQTEIDQHSTRLDDLTKKLSESNKRINELNKKLQEHADALNSLPKIMEGQKNAFDQLEARLRVVESSAATKGKKAKF